MPYNHRGQITRLVLPRLTPRATRVCLTPEEQANPFPHIDIYILNGEEAPCTYFISRTLCASRGVFKAVSKSHSGTDQIGFDTITVAAFPRCSTVRHSALTGIRPTVPTVQYTRGYNTANNTTSQRRPQDNVLLQQGVL